MSALKPFHLAIPVGDIATARAFYTSVLGCKVGRRDSRWIDFDFFGHQLVAHCVEPTKQQAPLDCNPVDGHDVPVPHFGVVLDWYDWQRLADSLTKKGVEFVIKPYIRFAGQTGEQATMFFYDPFGNALEFKAFKNPDDLFRKD
ncbi:VOC family protein [Kaarinaea lacus]